MKEMHFLILVKIGYIILLEKILQEVNKVVSKQKSNHNNQFTKKIRDDDIPLNDEKVSDD